MNGVDNPALSLLYTDFCKVGTWWNYKNLTSPIYRLYLITDGAATIYINQLKYKLKAGDLFLVPKFVTASYECLDYMEHYYICIFNRTPLDGIIQDPSKMKLKIPASSLDYALIQRFQELNPNKALPDTDPKVYDNNKQLYMEEDVRDFSDLPSRIESNGILQQLFSRFLTTSSITNMTAYSHLHNRLSTVIQHISTHIDGRLLVSDLADIMCVTPDHFTKVFKKVLGMGPNEYIQLKRIELAQTLLLTSSLSIQEIAEHVGIFSQAQFSKMFLKNAHCSPRKYRAMQLHLLGIKEVENL